MDISLTPSTDLADNQTYTVTVTAFDNTVDPAWSADSDPYTFKVNSTPQVTSVAPASGSVLAGSAKSSNLTITLDRPADTSTVAGSVGLHRNPESGSDPSYTVSCANSPCTTITVHPMAALPEGHELGNERAE